MSELQQKPELLGMFPDELRDYMLSLGEPKYRAAQMFPQLHRGISPQDMTSLPKATRARIAETAGCTVREVEHIIKQYTKMKQQMAMIQRMGGMEAVMARMQQQPGPKPQGAK